MSRLGGDSTGRAAQESTPAGVLFLNKMQHFCVSEGWGRCPAHPYDQDKPEAPLYSAEDRRQELGQNSRSGRDPHPTQCRQSRTLDPAQCIQPFLPGHHLPGQAEGHWRLCRGDDPEQHPHLGHVPSV